MQCHTVLYGVIRRHAEGGLTAPLSLFLKLLSDECLVIVDAYAAACISNHWGLVVLCMAS